MRVLSTATAVLAFERGTVTTSSAFQVLVPSSGSGRSTAAARRSSSNKAFPWAASSFRRRAAAVPLWCTSQTTDVAATAEGKGAKKEEGRGHGHGGGVKPKTDKNSFVQWDMRRAAMKLHTRDQSPKEGKQENKGAKFSDWKPSRRGYLQFLVDSKVVYEALEEACGSDPRLAEFRNTGLERTEALTKDIAWMLEAYPDSWAEGGGGDGKAPSPTENALEYASFLREKVASTLPGFMCHYYNHYFAHTAGGRMIGRKVAESCLDGRTLEFYQWGADDVKVLLDGVRVKIDAMAKGWSEEEKEACVSETARTFKYGGSLLSSITS
ncbi:unnamed protein product [Ectocarpus sp. 8 AP-2014]